MAQPSSFDNIIVWSSENEKKTRSPIRWTHDHIIFATYEDKLTVLKEPEMLIPVIFDMELEAIKSIELYDGVFEYKANDLTVEMIEGIEYSEYKLYGKTIDIDAVIQRLSANGVKLKKPEIPIIIPDRPAVLDEERINRQRFDYNEEILDKDTESAKRSTLKSVFRGITGVILFVVIGTYLGMEIFIPKTRDVTPEPEGFITALSNYIVYNIEGKMTVFKIDDTVDEIGYDSTCSIFIPERAEMKRNVVVERITDARGNTIYERGSRIVTFERNPTDYEYVNASPFLFDTYGDGSEADWSGLGELVKGEAQKVIFRHRVDIREGKYVLLLGRTRAILGDYSEDAPPFYEGLRDDISYAAVLFSIKAQKSIMLFGQIDKTLTKNEGRNTLQRLIFNFKTDYARQR